MSDLRIGKVAYIDNDSQSGVIVDTNAQDIEFEFQHLIDSIKVNDEVTFEIILDTNGLKAVNISMR